MALDAVATETVKFVRQKAYITTFFQPVLISLAIKQTVVVQVPVRGHLVSCPESLFGVFIPVFS